MTNPFGSDALAKAVRDSLDTPPAPDGARVGVAVQNGEAGVEGSVSKSIGKDSHISIEGSWYTRAGYRVGAFFGWTPKAR